MLEKDTVAELLANRPNATASIRGSRFGNKRLRLWLPLVVLGIALVFLITKGLGNSLVYFHTVDEAIAMKATLGSTTFRLEGVVVPGTVHSNSQGGVDFSVSGADGKRIYVIDSKNPPELFQPNLPVVLIGNFSGSAFLSTQIMVKHSSSYIAAHPDRVTSVGGKKL